MPMRKKKNSSKKQRRKNIKSLVKSFGTGVIPNNLEPSMKDRAKSSIVRMTRDALGVDSVGSMLRAVKANAQWEECAPKWGFSSSQRCLCVQCMSGAAISSVQLTPNGKRTFLDTIIEGSIIVPRPETWIGSECTKKSIYQRVVDSILDTPDSRRLNSLQTQCLCIDADVCSYMGSSKNMGTVSSVHKSAGLCSEERLCVCHSILTRMENKVTVMDSVEVLNEIILSGIVPAHIASFQDEEMDGGSVTRIMVDPDVDLMSVDGCLDVLRVAHECLTCCGLVGYGFNEWSYMFVNNSFTEEVYDEEEEVNFAAVCLHAAGVERPTLLRKRGTSPRAEPRKVVEGTLPLIFSPTSLTQEWGGKNRSIILRDVVDAVDPAFAELVTHQRLQLSLLCKTLNVRYYEPMLPMYVQSEYTGLDEAAIRKVETSCFGLKSHLLKRDGQEMASQIMDAAICSVLRLASKENCVAKAIRVLHTISYITTHVKDVVCPEEERLFSFIVNTADKIARDAYVSTPAMDTDVNNLLDAFQMRRAVPCLGGMVLADTQSLLQEGMEFVEATMQEEMGDKFAASVIAKALENIRYVREHVLTTIKSVPVAARAMRRALRANLENYRSDMLTPLIFQGILFFTYDWSVDKVLTEITQDKGWTVTQPYAVISEPFLYPHLNGTWWSMQLYKVAGMMLDSDTGVAVSVVPSKNIKLATDMETCITEPMAFTSLMYVDVLHRVMNIVKAWGYEMQYRDKNGMLPATSPFAMFAYKVSVLNAPKRSVPREKIIREFIADVVQGSSKRMTFCTQKNHVVFRAIWMPVMRWVTDIEQFLFSRMDIPRRCLCGKIKAASGELHANLWKTEPCLGVYPCPCVKESFDAQAKSNPLIKLWLHIIDVMSADMAVSKVAELQKELLEHWERAMPSSDDRKFLGMVNAFVPFLYLSHHKKVMKEAEVARTHAIEMLLKEEEEQKREEEKKRTERKRKQEEYKKKEEEQKYIAHFKKKMDKCIDQARKIGYKKTQQSFARARKEQKRREEKMRQQKQKVLKEKIQWEKHGLKQVKEWRNVWSIGFTV